MMNSKTAMIKIEVHRSDFGRRLLKSESKNEGEICGQRVDSWASSSL